MAAIPKVIARRVFEHCLLIARAGLSWITSPLSVLAPGIYCAWHEFQIRSLREIAMRFGLRRLSHKVDLDEIVQNLRCRSGLARWLPLFERLYPLVMPTDQVRFLLMVVYSLCELGKWNEARELIAWGHLRLGDRVSPELTSADEDTSNAHLQLTIGESLVDWLASEVERDESLPARMRGLRGDRWWRMPVLDLALAGRLGMGKRDITLLKHANRGGSAKA